MANRKTAATARTRVGGAVDADEGGRARFARIDRAGSQLVRDAAALLDEEMASGIIAARNMQERMDRERRIDKADFGEALQRLQGDAHQVLDLVSGQLGQVGDAENSELISRFTRNMHDLLDVVVGVVSTSAEIAGQLAEANLPKPTATRGAGTAAETSATGRTAATAAGAARARRR